MKLSQLLNARQVLLRQAGLANLAFAYDLLSGVATRLHRARLTGRVRLQSAEPDADRYWSTLTALDGRQSVIEEHFTDEDLNDLADAIAFATNRDALDLTFDLEDFASDFVAPLRAALEQAGITLDAGAAVDSLPQQQRSHDDR